MHLKLQNISSGTVKNTPLFGMPFQKTGVYIVFSEKHVLLDFNDKDQISYPINFLILTTKCYIYKCKMEGYHTSFQALRSYVRHICHIEEIASHPGNNKKFTASLRVMRSICNLLYLSMHRKHCGNKSCGKKRKKKTIVNSIK